MTMPKSLCPAALATILVLECAQARAKNYPYSGYFAMLNGQLPGSLDPAMCAFVFFHQRPDGIAISYHIDAARFEATREVRYLEFNRTYCTYNDVLGRETCKVTFDTNKAADPQTFDSVIVGLNRNYIFLGEGALFRCPFDAERLAKAITGEISALAVGDRDKLIMPTEEMLKRPMAAQMVKGMGLDGSLK